MVDDETSLGLRSAPPSVREGLTLAQLAGIDVALAEGHPPAAVFEQEGVDAAMYRAANAAWRQELARDPNELARFAELVATAEDCQARPTPPFDTDPRAWASLLNDARRSGGIAAAGKAIGLKRGDVSRLVRSWRARMASDEALAETVREHIGRVAPPSEVKLDPPVLKPYPWSPKGGGGTARAKRYEPMQKLVLSIDGELAAERDADVYAALVAIGETFPREIEHALELCGLVHADWDRLREDWRERMRTDTESRAAFTARLADHRALCAQLGKN